MKKKLLLSAVLAFCLCACSNSSANTGTVEEEVEETAEQAVEVLSSDEILDSAFDGLGLSMSKVDDVKISAPDASGNVKVSFTFDGKEYYCTVNNTTGEIVDHNVPDDVLKAVDEAADPFELAINAAFDSLEGYEGGAEDIKVKQSGTTIVVEFNWNGEHHTFNYDMNEGKIID